MARYNEILVGRYNRYLQKLLGMKGEPPAPQLASEITPNLQVFSGVEERYLQGWEIFGSFQTVAASVGNQGGIRLRNPVGSNVVAVIFKCKLIVNPPVNDTVTLRHGQATADLATIAPLQGGNFDPRTRPAPTCILSGQATTAAIPPLTASRGIDQLTFNAISDLDFLTNELHQLPLLPGDAYQLEEGALNTQIIGTFWWMERFLEEGERA